MSRATRVSRLCTVMPMVSIAVLLLTSSPALFAQRGVYPSSPIRMVVAFPPGGGVDVVARLIAQKMPGVWGQPVVVDNRPGAGSILATRLVASATPDGYTVLINSSSMVVNQVANANAGYDIERQLIPIINLAWQPNVIVATRGLPLSTLADVIALSRTRKLSYGSPGQGSVGHLAGEYLFSMLAKTNILHVPYNGAPPALTAVVSGQVEVAVMTLPPAVPLITAGKVKGIAVTSAKRASTVPDLPTVAESGFPTYEVNIFTGLFMPAGAPKAVVNRFYEAVLKVMVMPDTKEKLATLGYEPADTSSENFRRLVPEELKKWAKVIETTKIKIE
jgi:tripartite-type tricarboxylate transporter receptor subunit TctC